jgi:hypothetical protein
VVTDNITGKTATASQNITCNTVLSASIASGMRYTQNTTCTATISVTGGSGSFYYDWSVWDSSGGEIYAEAGTTVTQFSFVCSEAGTLTIKCVVTDNQTGQSATATKPIAVISNGGPPN